MGAGFQTVLRRVAKAWAEQQDSVLSMSADVMRQLREHTQPQGVLWLTSQGSPRPKLAKERQPAK